MTDSECLERELGPQEALFVELNRRCNGAVQLVAMAKLDHPVDVADLQRALVVVHGRHPLLRARVDERDKLWWVCDVPFDEIDVRVEPMARDFDLEAVYAAEAAIVHDVAHASWRLVALTDTSGKAAWLVLVTNHSAVDGRSALVVLNELDLLISDPGALDRSSLPLTGAPELGLAAAGLEGERGLFEAWPDEAIWPVEQPAAGDVRRPNAMLRVLPASDLEALHDRLHGEGLHLAAGFCAAAIRAAPALPGHTAWTGIVAPTDVRADCRPAIAGNAVGEFVAAINVFTGPEQGDMSLIEIARILDRQLHENRVPALHMDTDVSLAVSTSQADQIAAASDVFASGICVSDVGDLDRLSGRRVGMSQVLIMPSQNHGVHPIMVAIVSTSAGACLSIGYDEPLRSRAAAHAFADRYLEALTDMAHTT